MIAVGALMVGWVLKADEQFGRAVHVRPCLRVSSGALPPFAQTLSFIQERFQSRVQQLEPTGVIIRDCHGIEEVTLRSAPALFNFGHRRAGSCQNQNDPLKPMPIDDPLDQIDTQNLMTFHSRRGRMLHARTG